MAAWRNFSSSIEKKNCVTMTTVIFSQVKITCYRAKDSWYFIGVYIIKSVIFLFKVPV